MASKVSEDVALVVRVKRAMEMLDCGRNQIYDLINDKKVDSFLDGKARKITVASIKDYIKARIEADKARKSR